MILLRRRRKRRRRPYARTRPRASARVHLKIAAAGVSDRSVAAPRARFQNVYFKMVVAGLRREIVNVRFIFKSSRRRAATDPALSVGRSRSVCRYYTHRRPLKTRPLKAWRRVTSRNQLTGSVRIVVFRSSLKLTPQVQNAISIEAAD